MKRIFLFLLIMGLSISGYARPGNMIQVKGSDTMVNVVQAMAEDYMAKNKGKMISVTGGGSGTGIAALINNTCDVANSSRDIKDKEKKSAGGSISEVILGIDGLSIIVNKANGIKDISIAQLGQIFKGEIKNWKELGGKDLPISLYGRQPNSGTYDFFREHILNKADYSKDVKEMNGNAQIVESVKSSPAAIGYVGSGYVQNTKTVKVLSVSNVKGGKSYAPTKANIVNKKYPISRPLYQYIKGTMSDDVRGFISYELSKDGQRIMELQGFFPISKEQEKTNKTILNKKS